MQPFSTKTLPAAPDVIAPDGSNVRILLGLRSGGMAHFELAPGAVSRAVTHCTVEEIWFVLSGQGEMWRKSAEQAEVIELTVGVCLTIPLGTAFQFRCLGTEPLTAVAVTMPPWPGDKEAVEVKGIWQPAV